MKIRRLAIGEFGILRNQRMEDIAGDIVVLAGPNRAGKTTFMQLLRYLGYQFPRTDLIPPPVHEYKVEADVVTDTGEKYRIHRTGYGSPEVVSEQNEPDVTIDSLYFPDSFTYQQLFTISLDELRRIPSGNSGSDAKKLYSVLLGAGLAEIAVIPEIREQFTKEASKIGGVNGTPSVKQFKSDYEVIQNALERRQSANRQVEEYEQTVNELDKIKMSIEALSREEDSEQLRHDRLEFLVQYRDTYKDLQKARNILEDSDQQKLLETFSESNLPEAKRLAHEYPQVVEQFNDRLDSFKHAVDGENWKPLYEQLLEEKQSLHRWEKTLSGLRQRITDYQLDHEKQQQEKRDIYDRMQRINASWPDNFNVLDSVHVDQIEISQLRHTVSAHRECHRVIKNLEGEQERLQREIEQKDIDYQSIERQSRGFLGWPLGIIIFLVILAGGGWNLLEGSLAGLFVAGIGIIALTGWIVMSVMANSQKNRELRAKNSERRRLSVERQKVDEQIQKLSETFTGLSEEITQYRDDLDLESEIEPEVLADYYREVVDIKSAVRKWKTSITELEKREQEIRIDLIRINQILTTLEFPTIPEKSLLEQNEQLLQNLELVIEWLSKAESLRQQRSEKDRYEELIQQILLENEGQLDLEESSANPDILIKRLQEFIDRGEKYHESVSHQKTFEECARTICTAFSGRVREAFREHGEVSENTIEEILPVLTSAYQEYISQKDIHDERESLEARLEEIGNELETLREKRAKKEQLAEELATSEKLQQAQEEIDEARTRLEPLAREYAVNRLAELIASRFQKHFLHKTRDELLNKSSEVFQRITSGDYARIDPPEELEQMDFRVVSQDGAETNSTSSLSRGTREQLFLAVRLSRIFELDPLPVILDDSFVNFDTGHRAQATQIISELARRNQVFVLTCHPEIIRYLANTKLKPQYWTIEDGNIQHGNFNDAVSVLGGEST